jgi:hypothetical protein
LIAPWRSTLRTFFVLRHDHRKGRLPSLALPGQGATSFAGKPADLRRAGENGVGDGNASS